MRVFRGFDSLPNLGNTVVTVGSFDGVHRGHLSLLERACEVAKAKGVESVVLTFEPHPRVVLGQADGLRLLTTLEEKSRVLESCGVDNLIVIPFNKEFSRLTYDAFIKEYLSAKVGLDTLVVGYNHNMGRGSEGLYSSFVEMGASCGFDICKVDEWRDDDGMQVSSTVLRMLVARGEMLRAASLMSRPYLIVGRADGDGRVWSPDALKLYPAEGRYKVLLNGVEWYITVDDKGALWCEKESRDVVIEIISDRL